MTKQLAEIAVVVTSFERPHSLRRSLLSLSLQASRQFLAEILVADDGSLDETWHIVDTFAQLSELPVTFTTHPHGEFQPGRSRNEAALSSTAPYLIFLDGDCVVPPNFLATHAEMRQKRVALCGESMRLTQANSRRVTDEAIRNGTLDRFVEPVEQRRLARKARKDRVYSFFRLPMRPRLTGNHFSLWREDFERIGGFDLGFRGWGPEDRDLQRRLLRAGVRCKTVLPKTVGYHLWHPPVESYLCRALNDHNEAYYRSQRRSLHFAVSGLDDVANMPHEIWRWREGKLVDRHRVAG